VVVFSGVAMANTVEVKEEVVVNNKLLVEEADECQEFAMNVKNLLWIL
jgi:hypothetical protein